MKRTRTWLLLTAWVLLHGLWACDNGPVAESDPVVIQAPDGLFVSDPVAGLDAAESLSDLEEESGGVYVSARPGSFPGGVHAIVRNLATGDSTSAAVEDGGFDPLIIPGEPGQTLEIAVRAANGSISLLKIIVPDRRRPRVVRTRPPDGETDVVLNGSMAVVFSEPISAGSITGETVMLFRDGEAVDVTSTIRIDGLLAQFVPNDLLAPDTPYTFVVTTGVLDRSGDPLEEELVASFTTETPRAQRLAFTVQPSVTLGAQAMEPAVQVAILDRYGNTVAGAEDPVTLALATNPAGGTLLGTTTVNAENGIATFTGLAIDRPGKGYALVATADGLISATSSPFDITLTFTSISASPISTCGLTTTGAVYCWGFGAYGNLGDGRGTNSPTPVLVAGGLSFLAVDGNCGIAATGQTYCWGENRFGQVGDGTTTDRLEPVPVAGGLRLESVSSGGSHACGITAAGEAYCWGDDFSGQLGDGTTTQSLTPVRVSGSLTLISVSTGSDHTCGVSSAGEGYCWGSNHFGQLGDGTILNRLVPALLTGNIEFGSISADYLSSCGVARDGPAYCWGNNYLGALGDGSNTNRRVPVPVSGGMSFLSVSGNGGHTCGVTTTGVAYCWGENANGQLGNGTTVGSTVPVPVSGSSGFISVSTGGRHTCALTLTGEAYCWGENNEGQLGDGTAITRLTPVRVVH